MFMLKECEILSILPCTLKDRGIPGLKFARTKPSRVRACVCMLYNNSNCTVVCLFCHWSPSDEVRQSCYSLSQQLFSISLYFLSRVALDLHYCIVCKHYCVTASKLSQLQRTALICLHLSHVGYSRCW